MVSDALFIQGQLFRGHRNWSLTLGTHGHFLCWLWSSELIVQDSDLSVRLSPRSGGLSFRSRRIQKPHTLWPFLLPFSLPYIESLHAWLPIAITSLPIFSSRVQAGVWWCRCPLLLTWWYHGSPFPSLPQHNSPKLCNSTGKERMCIAGWSSLGNLIQKNYEQHFCPGNCADAGETMWEEEASSYKKVIH